MTHVLCLGCHFSQGSNPCLGCFLKGCGDAWCTGHNLSDPSGTFQGVHRLQKTRTTGLIARGEQGLRASSLQFTSPLEFNAIFRYGFPLRVDLNG